MSAQSKLTRRQFAGTAALGSLAWGASQLSGAAAPTRPSFLVVITDQLSMDAIAAHGCPDVRTPNIDRLVHAGVSFRESYSANPVCGPARSSIWTGRMPSETGVNTNDFPILSTVPNIGQWLGENGYETVYAGKWHLPDTVSKLIPGFTVLPGGMGGQGHLSDAAVSSACQGWLHARRSGSPFLLIASLLQPHDICAWISSHSRDAEWEPMARIEGPLPELPVNFRYDPREPKGAILPRPKWSEQQWRYFRWSYYRHVEMVDAEIGRILDALEDAGHAKNTVVVFTADHGEGSGHHQLVLKNFLYDDAAKVPLIVSCPGRIPSGIQDTAHFASGTDIAPTIFDYAGVKSPPNVVGRSLRPLLEGKRVEWRDFVAAEAANGGRMIRTANYKYIVYPNDPVEQLFDWKKDPGETRNVAGESWYASALRDHRRLLQEWTSRLIVAPAVPGKKTKSKSES